MAISGKDLEYKIKVDAADAEKQIGSVTAATNKLGDATGKAADSLSGLKGAFSNIGASIVVFNQALDLVSRAYSAVIGNVREMIDLFSIQEQVETNLANAMRLTGSYTDSAMKSMLDFASGLQKVTVVGDETTIKLLAIAKGIGVSDEQAKKFVKTAIDLSAATGLALETAFQGLLDTTKGTADTLARFAPELRRLTKEEIQAGQALDLLSTKFAGFAEGQAKSTRGAVLQMGNAWGDLKEQVGKFLVEGLGLIGIMGKLRSAVESAGMGIAGLSKTLAEWMAVATRVKTVIAGIDFKGLAKDVAIFALELGAVVAAITIIGPAIAAINLGTILAVVSSIGAAVVAVKAAILAALPGLLAFLGSAATIALMTAKFLALAVAIDLVVRNIDKLGSLFAATFGDIGAWLTYATASIVEFSSALGQMLSAIGMEEKGKAFEGWTKRTSKNLLELADSIGEAASSSKQKIDLGFIGKAMTEVEGVIKRIDSTSTTTAKSITPIKDELSNLAKVSQDAFVPPSEETIRRYDAIKGSLEGLRGEVDKLSLSQADAVRTAAARSLAEIAAVQKTLQAEQRLTAEREKVLAEVASLTIKRRDETIKAILEQENKAQLEAKTLYYRALNDETNLQAVEYQKQSQQFADLQRNKQLTAEQVSQALVAIERQQAAARVAAQRDASLAVAQVTGDQVRQAQLDYERQMVAFQEMADKQRISAEQLAEAEIALRKKVREAEEARSVSVAQRAVDAIGGGIQGVVSAIGSAFGPIGNLIAGVVNILNRGPEEMKKMVDGLIDAANQLPQNIARNIPIIIRSIVEKLPDSLRSVLATISIMIKDILFNKQFWMDIVNGLLEAVIATFKDLKDWLFKGVDFSGITEGVSNAVSSAFKSISGVGGELFNLQDITAGPVKNISDNSIKNLKAAGLQVTNWLKMAWDAFRQAGTWVVGLLGNAWEGLKQVGKWLDSNVFQPIYNAFKPVFLAFDQLVIQPLKSVFDLFISAFNIALTLAGKVLTAISDYVGTTLRGVWKDITVVWDGMIATMKAAWGFIVELLKTPIELFKAAFRFIVDLFKNPEQAFRNLFNDIAGILGKLADKFAGVFKPLLDVGGKVWESLKEKLANVGQLFAGIGTAVVVAARDAAGKASDFIYGLGKSVWAGFYAAATGAERGVRKLGDLIWQAIKDGFTSALDFFKDIGKSIFGGIGGGVGNVLSTVGGAIGGAVATVGKVFGFAQGGLVLPQYAAAGALMQPIGTDTVPAMLTPGEFVLSRSAVQGLGIPTIRALNDGVLGGKLSQPVVNNYAVSLSIKTEQPIDERFVREKLMPTIENSLRKGSLNGKRVLAPAGVRG